MDWSINASLILPCLPVVPILKSWTRYVKSRITFGSHGTTHVESTSFTYKGIEWVQNSCSGVALMIIPHSHRAYICTSQVVEGTRCASIFTPCITFGVLGTASRVAFYTSAPWLSDLDRLLIFSASSNTSILAAHLHIHYSLAWWMSGQKRRVILYIEATCISRLVASLIQHLAWRYFQNAIMGFFLERPISRRELRQTARLAGYRVSWTSQI